MPTVTEFASIRSYRLFEQYVKSESRFVLNTTQQEFLDAVLATICPKRGKQLRSKTCLFRAQKGFREEAAIERMPLLSRGTEAIEEEVEVLVKLPYLPERMMPYPQCTIDGRISVRGIPCLYAATTAAAAISEVRPWVGLHVTLAQFETTRNLRLVDCSLDKTESYLLEPIFPDSPEPDPAIRERGVWGDIGHAFSKPVTHDEPHLDYVPTQFLSEVFRNAGYDGVAYKSLLNKDGANVALFDLASVRIRDTCLYQTRCVSMTSAKMEDQHSAATWPPSITSELRDNGPYINLNEISDE